MSKRSQRDDNARDISKKPKKTGSWAQGLLGSMNDPEFIVENDDKVVVIRDKYPKANHHYLVLCKENISGILKLTRAHLPLLRHMDRVARTLVSTIDVLCTIGYHSVPSMQRLHLHVISEDMDSPCLKTKVHWNSFTTKFFVPSEDLIKMIEDSGKVERLSDEVHKRLLATPLKCHKCPHTPVSMPALKRHLAEHAVVL